MRELEQQTVRRNVFGIVCANILRHFRNVIVCSLYRECIGNFNFTSSSLIMPALFKC